MARNKYTNAMATSVGSRAITIKQAVIIAAVFEFAGAVLAGGEVTKTIRKGIIDASSLAETPELLVYGMLASLLASAVWLLIASRRGWPVSTTHSIIGAIIVTATHQTWWSTALGFLAVAFATLNVVGGFLVTHRMLAMFKRKG